jgi:hypothetical protein
MRSGFSRPEIAETNWFSAAFFESHECRETNRRLNLGLFVNVLINYVPMNLLRLGLIERGCSVLGTSPFLPRWRSLASDQSLGSQRHGRNIVVLLFAWLGASDRHISKYVDVFESSAEGDTAVNVLVFKPTMMETAIPRVGEKKAIEHAGRIIAWLEEERHQQQVDVIFHCMSNAGWMAAGTLFYMEHEMKKKLMEMKHHREKTNTVLDVNEKYDEDEIESMLEKWKEMRQDIRGIILDSAPSLPMPHVWAKGLTSSLTGTSSSFIDSEHPFMLSMANSLSRKYFESSEVLKRFRKIREAWSKYVPSSCARLYFYSNADALIPSSHVENFIRSERMNGVKEQYTFCSSSASHCAILQKHPEDYAAKVKQFLENTAR